MAVTLTSLLDNLNPAPNLASEFGFSLYLEAGGRKILFDTGSTGVFCDNAKALGVDLSALDAVVLSHGHFDHARGYTRLVEEGLTHAPLYLHRYFFTERYWHQTALDGLYEPTGSGLSQSYLMRHRVACKGICADVFPLFADAGIYIVANFARQCEFEMADPTNVAKIGGGFVVDDYRDEIALAVELAEGLLVITGCAHAGLVNICQSAAARLGRPVTAFVGGTHLAASPPARAEATLRWVNASALKTLALCHCTGEDARNTFAQGCPACVSLSTGETLTFE